MTLLQSWRALLLPMLTLAGCAAPTIAPQPAVVRVSPDPGLARVIGRPASTALALLGRPGLDRREGPAQHLQFVKAGCVLDLFYVPVAGLLTARHAEARTLDGRRDDAAACLARQLAG